MKMMPRIIAAVAIVAMCGFASTAQAQSVYTDGYSFGSGIGNSFPYPGNAGAGFSGICGFGGVGLAQRFEEPPYFAKFPPVYYSHIVKRPYGISPYAAPPGIAPVEMQYAVKPVRVTNPHYNEGDAVPVPAVDSPVPPLPPPMLNDPKEDANILAETSDASTPPKKNRKK